MRACLFDCETTGLIANRTVKVTKQPEVIEFYACVADCETGEIFEELDTLVRPVSSEITAKITEITGLTHEKVRDAPTFREVADAVRAIIEPSPCVIGHNVSFDVEVVDIEFERLGQRITWPPRVCTVEQTLHLLGRHQKLQDLHVHLLGRKFDGAHRAKSDVLALLACCGEMFRRGML